MDGLGASTSPLRTPRILVVTNLYPTRSHPAFGTFVGARVRALRRAGATVTVAAITDPTPHRNVARKYLRLALIGARSGLSARLQGQPFDVVEAHIAFPTGMVAWPIAALGGSRLSLFCHGSDVIVLPWRSAGGPLWPAASSAARTSCSRIAATPRTSPSSGSDPCAGQPSW